jgi:peroxiredoxin-like protein
MEPHYYQVNLEWKEGRLGEISSPELNHSIEIATPPQFASGIEGVWSPEHLLTAAVNSCFMTTFLAIAENSKLSFKSFQCSVKGILEKVDNKMLMSEMIIEPILEITHEGDKERAERILEKSEAACLISNSIKSTIQLSNTIKY